MTPGSTPQGYQLTETAEDELGEILAKIAHRDDLARALVSGVAARSQPSSWLKRSAAVRRASILPLDPGLQLRLVSGVVAPNE